MMVALIARWMSTKLALAGGYILLALTVAVSLRQAGRRTEQMDAFRKTLNAVEDKNAITTDIGRLPDSAVRKRLRVWTRD